MSDDAIYTKRLVAEQRVLQLEAENQRLRGQNAALEFVLDTHCPEWRDTDEAQALQESGDE